MSHALWLSIDDDEPVETTLEAFFAENAFDPEEQVEIAGLVAEADLYFGGGGAAPGFVLGTPPAVSAWLADIRA